MSNQKDIDFLIANGFSGSLTQMSYDYLLAETGLTGADRTRMFHQYLINRGFTGQATSDLLQNAASFHGKGSVTALHNDIGIFAMLPVPLSQMNLVSDLLLTHGTGVATFTRSTIGTFIDKDDGLVKTAAIDAARFEQNGILIEGTSDNLALRSEEVDNAIWSKTGGITFAADQSTGADGTLTADQITYIGGQGSPSTRGTQQSVTVPGGTAGKTFTVSYWVRSVTGTSKFRFNNTHGGVQANFSPDITATTTLTRFDFTVTNGVAAGNGIQFIGIIGATDDSAYDLYVWGYQLEELPFPSSYIKTVASTVTRTADNLSIDAANIPAPTADYSISLDFISDGFGSGFPTYYKVEGETSRHGFLVESGSQIRAIHGTTTSLTGFTTGALTKVAVVVDSTDITLYTNGIQRDKDPKTSVTGTATSISIGKNGSVEFTFGHIKNFRTYAAALTANQVGTL